MVVCVVVIQVGNCCPQSRPDRLCLMMQYVMLSDRIRRWVSFHCFRERYFWIIQLSSRRLRVLARSLLGNLTHKARKLILSEIESRS